MASSPQPASKARYLVVESRNQTTLLRELYSAAENPRWLYLFAETEWQAFLQEGPILLEAAQDSAEYRWALRGLKDEHLIGLILESSRGLDAVASWLRARLTVRVDGQRKGLLRFYDSRIWHGLAPRTNPEADVIERAIYWHGPSGRKQWRTTENPEPIVMSPAPALGEHQWVVLNATNAQP